LIDKKINDPKIFNAKLFELEKNGWLKKK
jgi:hypothetical protein